MDTSHTMSWPSRETEASRLPSSEKRMSRAWSVWPRRIRRVSPVRASVSRMGRGLLVVDLGGEQPAVRADVEHHPRRRTSVDHTFRPVATSYAVSGEAV